MPAKSDFEFVVDKKELRRLERNLRRLPAKITKRVLGGAVKHGLKPMVAAARGHRRRQNRGWSSGLIAASLGVIMKRYRASGNVVGILAARKGFKRSVQIRDPQTGRTRSREENPEVIAHLIEGGTQPHSLLSGASIRKARGQRFGHGGMHPGARAAPFIIPAYDETKERVVERFRSRLIKGLDREAAKLDLGK